MGHPITPPGELVQRLRKQAPHGIRDAGVTRELYLIAAAYCAGADQELEACCEWVKGNLDSYWAPTNLRAARRPKPPRLKDRALARLTLLEDLAQAMGHSPDDTIRQALEQLNDH